MPIGKALKLTCYKYQLTQKKMAEIAGKSEQTICSYVNGRSIPNFLVIQDIADYLEIKPSELIKLGEIWKEQ